MLLLENTCCRLDKKQEKQEVRVSGSSVPCSDLGCLRRVSQDGFWECQDRSVDPDLAILALEADAKTLADIPKEHSTCCIK